jgi:uncharacterized protein (DUF885 family)
MLNYEDYFNDLTKINAHLNFYINKPKVLKKYTNILSDDYLNKCHNLNKKYSNTKDLELKRTINFEKKNLSYKLYLYNLISSNENQILIFEDENNKLFPVKYKKEREADFHKYLKTLIMRLNEALEKEITIPVIIIKKIIIELKKLKKYKYVYDYLKNVYLPKARKTIGLCNLKKGKKIYKLLLKNLIDKTPEYVHKLGLSLVSKIKPLKNNEQNTYKSREALFKDCLEVSLYVYNNIIDKNFYYKPSKPFNIQKVKKEMEYIFPMAYYSPIEDTIYINLRFYNECTKQSLYPLLIHECFHQYHYLFMKYHKLKKYQIYGYNNLTFLEGFAHYMEIYCDKNCDNKNDPNNYDGIENHSDNYYSILRKIRLVADTGINYYGWSYKKTFNFMKKYLQNKTNDIINEIDRYICNPGQALCYVIGKLEIIKMRDKYLKENKTKTIKDFHERLLINGTCSLSTIKKLL